MYIVSLGLSLIVLLAFYFILSFHKFYLLVLAILLGSPGMVFITPISLDYGSKLALDVNESSSCGIIMAMAQTMSVIEITICDKLKEYYIGKQGVLYMLMMMTAANIISLILSTIIKDSAKQSPLLNKI